jgi:hypothetical protein
MVMARVLFKVSGLIRRVCLPALRCVAAFGAIALIVSPGKVGASPSAPPDVTTGTLLSSIAPLPGGNRVPAPGAEANRLIVSGFPSPVTAGAAHDFTVTALDSSNTTDTGYIGTLHFTSTDTLAVLPDDYTFSPADGGVKVFVAGSTLKTRGTWSITATATDNASINGSQLGIVVIPAAVVQIRVETAASGSGLVVAAQNVAAGSSVTGYAITRDSFGNFVANDPGAWSLVNITPGVVLGDLVAPGDNRSAVFTGHVVGAASLRVTSGGFTGDSGLLTVVPGPASTLVVSGFPSTVTAGTTHSLTVTAKDSNGNIATGYTGTVRLTSSDGQAVLQGNHPFVSTDAGSFTFYYGHRHG